MIFPAEIRSRIDLLGPIPDDAVNRCLQNADLFVAPPRRVLRPGLSRSHAVGHPRHRNPGRAIPEIVEHGNGVPGSTSFARRTGRGNDHVTQGFARAAASAKQGGGGGDALCVGGWPGKWTVCTETLSTSGGQEGAQGNCGNTALARGSQYIERFSANALRRRWPEYEGMIAMRREHRNRK